MSTTCYRVETETEYLVAQNALNHVSNIESELLKALKILDWDGCYIAQVGHNEEALEEGYLVEQILIHLDADFPQSATEDQIISELKPIISPYLTIVHTPIHSINVVPKVDPKTLQERRRGGKLAPVDGDEANTPSGGNGGCSNVGGSRGNPVSHGSRGAGGDQPHETNDLPGEGGSGGSGTAQVDGRIDKPGTCVIIIPFTSNLVGEKGELLFQIAGNVKIEIETNFECKHKPTDYDSDWPNPWVGIRIRNLSTLAYAEHNIYKLVMFEPRLSATAKKPATVLRCLPDVTRTRVTKLRDDKSKSGTLQLTMASANPGVHVGGSSTQTGSVEKEPASWDINPTQLHGDERAGAIWKYYNSSTVDWSHKFDCPPRISFGRSRGDDHDWPQLEVEMVMCWSLQKSKPIQRSRSFLHGSQGTSAFKTVLHRTMLSVNLEGFDFSEVSVEGCSTTDKYVLRPSQLPEDPGCQSFKYDPMVYKMEYGTGGTLVSHQRMSLHQAVYGLTRKLSADELEGPMSVITG